ncbi:FtsK/SpoIIIE domain-containing protein [Micromonospora olivasterospora]|uniref:FtsK/SpoIIIE domain-containing protein n=1 Tax=Micromonospora olivasterospora TaxID=1880 RepID=UPI0014781557|nr:FtsK/SpoIIIE domain-containing protein [Micromonospora olivasterospora]
MGKRVQGWEWRVAGWAARHPGFVAAPAAAAAGVVQFGPVTAGGVVAGAVAAGVGWYRGHPESWSRLAAPRLRAVRRRWLSRAYLGPWWSRVVEACNLVTVHRTTGVINVPRIIRVRSHSPSTETVYVRLLLGQTPKMWEEAADALAVALRAERVGVERVRPQVIALIVQRSEPFTESIIPPDILADSDAVDLSRVYLGETEHGTDWYAPLVGQHWLIAGATGSGKNSVTWMALRACAPLIRDGLVRLHVVNPKGTELNALRPVSYRYAETDADIVDVIQGFWSTMQDRKQVLAEQGRRTFAMSRETPLDLLVVDELGAVTGYGDRSLTRGAQAALPLILSQARALGGSVIGALQEPTKDVIPQRDLFSLRVCLRATSAGHVDMVLGEDMRRRGALADEIPNVPESAGIGFVVKQRSRTPVRVRAAYCDDSDIAELVRVAGWPVSELAAARHG